MSAYVISDVSAKDAEAFAAYRDRAAATVAHHGGQDVVRGGAVEAREGGWHRGMIVVVEFPDAAAAHAWYRSPEYAKALGLREAAVTRNLIVVEGVDTHP